MTIDGKDLYETWGAILLEGSYNSLFKYPKRQTVSFRNYAEMDGIVPDLRKITFEPKQVTLHFAIRHRSIDEFWNKYQSFFTDMIAPGYRTVHAGMGWIHKLRYDKTAQYESPHLFSGGSSLTAFTLHFLEDNHAIPETLHPKGGINLRGWYEINGIDFGEFGVHHDGEIGKVLQYPDVKQPFTDGRKTDLDTRRLMHKEITIPLWMIAHSEEEFLTNYAAFFNQFNQSGTLKLFIREIGGVTNVYYTDCTPFSVNWSKKISARFGITVLAPVFTWLDASDTNLVIVLEDTDLGILVNEEDKIITFNR
jgi:hypothetical protein